MDSNLSFCSFSGHRDVLGRTDCSSTRAECRGQEIEQSFKGHYQERSCSRCCQVRGEANQSALFSGKGWENLGSKGNETQRAKRGAKIK